MAISFGTVGAFNSANNGSVTPTLPSGTVGDLILLLAYGRGAGTLGAPAGYSTAFNVQYTTSATSTQALFYLVSVGGEGNPTVTYTGGAAGDDVLGEIVRVTGAHATTPILQAGAGSDNGSQANIGAIDALTTLEADSVVVVVGARRDDWTSVGTIAAAGAWTFTEISDAAESTAGNDAGMVWDWAPNISGIGATTGTKTFIVTGGTANPGGGNMVEIAAAAVVVSPFTSRVWPMPVTITPSRVAVFSQDWVWQKRLRNDDSCPAGPYLSVLATNAGGGTVAWVNPANVYASDNVYATATCVAQTTQQLYVRNFNFQIPVDQQIDGILVECEAKSTLAGNTVRCQMVSGVIPVGVERVNTWENVEAQVDYGDSTDLWDYASWTPAQVNAGPFGVIVYQSDALTATLSLDAVRITVYCSVAAVFLPRRGMDQPMMSAGLLNW